LSLVLERAGMVFFPSYSKPRWGIFLRSVTIWSSSVSQVRHVRSIDPCRYATC